MKTPEGYEKDEIKKYLQEIEAWYFSPYMSGYGPSGIPDIVGCFKPSGVLFGIEVKREGKEATPRQRRRMEDIRKAGGVAFCGTAAQVIEALGKWQKHFTTTKNGTC